MNLSQHGQLWKYLLLMKYKNLSGIYTNWVNRDKCAYVSFSVYRFKQITTKHQYSPKRSWWAKYV